MRKRRARRRPGARATRRAGASGRAWLAAAAVDRSERVECAFEESAEDERKAGDGRTLTSAFGSSPSVYARYLMCDGFALKGDGAICTPRPPPLPPPMARVSRERACPFGPRLRGNRTGAHPTGPRARSRADELRPRSRLPLARLARGSGLYHPSTLGGGTLCRQARRVETSPLRCRLVENVAKAQNEFALRSVNVSAELLFSSKTTTLIISRLTSHAKTIYAFWGLGVYSIPYVKAKG